MLKNLLSLTKPGIIFGNLITVTGGFFLGAQGRQIDYKLYLVTILGVSCVIACGCVFNNYIDQDIDKIMQRTKNRALAQGIISNRIAIIFAIILGLFGLSVLFFYTTLIATSSALIGLFVYVVIYTLWLKRTSIYGTIVGSISGAAPPVVGYCAATGNFDAGAVILFAMLSLWQLPHSYSIALYRINDYKLANIPVLPVKKGVYLTKIHTLSSIIAFVIISLLLTLYKYTGYIYFFGAFVSGLIWVWLASLGLKAQSNQIWARKMFILSLVNITLLSILMSVDVYPSR